MAQISPPRKRGTIRRRVLMIALIPSTTLLLVGVVLAGYVISNAVNIRDYTRKIQNSEGPSIPFFVAIQQERQLTVSLIAGAQTARPLLAAARPKTDAAASAAIGNLKENFAGDASVPASVQQNIVTFIGLYGRIPAVRQQADTGGIPITEAFSFYNQIIDQFIQGVAGLAQNSSDAQNAFDRLITIPLFTAADGMTRADALATAGLAAKGLGTEDSRQFLGQIGAYHALLESSTATMTPDVRAKYDQLVASQAWQTVIQVENTFLRGDFSRLPVAQDQWRAAVRAVSGALMALFVQQHLAASQHAIDQAEREFTESVFAGVAAVLFAIFVVFIAVRLSNRLIGRLHRLREDTLDAAEVRLPELVARVQAGEPVDLEEGGHFLDHGNDEIGQVADAFNKAQQTAIAAAIDEAKTREGTKTVFLNIAHRSQVIVHRQLKVLDQAERKQEDPDQLDTLFQLDHLSTRARRNAENLIILGGGQPGRQWRNPVGLAELVRGASAETEDFARVKTGQLPQIAVRGQVVGDLVHLLAELIDNATSFSPPQSRVEIRGNVVGKGVVIEVEDQGLGLEPEQTDEINTLLADPPDFGIMALSEEPRLGLFVVGRLASRHGIQVHLRESAYGGTRAIVLVRTDLLAPIAEAEAKPVRPPKSETPSPAVDERPAPPPAAVRQRTTRPATEPVPSADAWPQSDTELPSVSPPPAPQRTVLERPPRAAVRPQVWRPEQPRPSTPEPPPAEEPGRPALPRRQRQQNLATQLRDRKPAQEPENVRPDSPEAARHRLSAFQQGTRRGRAEERGDDPNRLDTVTGPADLRP